MEVIIKNFLQQTPIEYWVMIGGFLLLLIIQMYYYFRFYNKILRYDRKKRKNKVCFTTSQPPVSVIICAQNEADNLAKYLPKVLEQKYDGGFQVIVVNDGSTDESSELLEKLSKQYDNLYATFLPMDAKYTSRKKMCLTVAIKAAKYEHLLFLDADCEPSSDKWIAEMMNNYVNGTDIVLGYSKRETKNNFLGRLIRYDSVTNAMHFMGMAFRGDAYRGTGRNLSYKKSLFFNGKGFSNHLNLIAGEDSLFIQDVATKKNVRCETRQTATTISHREETKKSYCFQKEDQLKAFCRYKKSVRFSIFFENFTRILFYLAFVALMAFMLIKQEWIMALIALHIFFFRYITQVIIIRRTAKLLNKKNFFFSIPLLDFILPFISLHLLTFGRTKTRKRV